MKEEDAKYEYEDTDKHKETNTKRQDCSQPRKEKTGVRVGPYRFLLAADFPIRKWTHITNRIKQEKIRQGKTRQDAIRQGKIGQDKKRQDKTRQAKARQGKARHDKRN
jgi:hypothetical protein